MALLQDVLLLFSIERCWVFQVKDSKFLAVFSHDGLPLLAAPLAIVDAEHRRHIEPVCIGVLQDSRLQTVNYKL